MPFGSFVQVSVHLLFETLAIFDDPASTLTSSCVQVLNYCRNRKHIYPLWFSGISNQIMWWTYVKAFWRGVAGATGAKITFKTTLKGAGRCVQFSCDGHASACQPRNSQ